MNRMNRVFPKILFSVLLGVGSTEATVHNDDVAATPGTSDTQATKGTDETRNLAPGTFESRPVHARANRVSESRSGGNSSVGPQSRSVTPGGMETTSGGSGANISNTPSNITPATTPPL